MVANEQFRCLLIPVLGELWAQRPSERQVKAGSRVWIIHRFCLNEDSWGLRSKTLTLRPVGTKQWIFSEHSQWLPSQADHTWEAQLLRMTAQLQSLLFPHHYHIWWCGYPCEFGRILAYSRTRIFLSSGCFSLHLKMNNVPRVET